MEALPVSVIVVSRERPEALTRCILGLSQLDYPTFEVIVVACPAGIEASGQHATADHLKLVPFDEPNISAARNAGIAVAAGEIVAFIDDDAVPEPLWLKHLVSAFEAPEVAAAGGYVLGRNGISFQWQARSVDAFGEAHAIGLDGDAPQVLSPAEGRAIKTEGTNMAVRREVLAGLGGFDPGYHFYLDETDLNMRLAAEGYATAIVPLAQVHHGFAESRRRAADRTPLDLTEIGASKMRFLMKFAPPKEHRKAWRAFRKAQRIRLLRLLQSGPLGPDDVFRLLHGLDKGRKRGLKREIKPLASIPHPTSDFQPFPSRFGAPRSIQAGRIWRRKALREQARQSVAKGEIVSLFIFSPTHKRHAVSFTLDGFWEQSGGRFGQSLRQGRRMRYWRLASRVRAESDRIAPVRGG